MVRQYPSCRTNADFFELLTASHLSAAAPESSGRSDLIETLALIAPILNNLPIGC